jgi:hypothetical protein
MMAMGLFDGLRLSPIERSMGRLMRAPDEHPGGENVTDAAPAADPAPADPAPAADPAPGDDQTLLGDPKSAGEQKPAEGDPKPAEGDPAKPEGEEEGPKGAPEKYELTAPEGATFDQAGFDLLEPVLRDLNLDNEQAQKLADIAPAYAEHVLSEAAKAQTAKVMADRASWANETKADAEVGGVNLEKSTAMAAKAIDRFAGTDTFTVTLDGQPQQMTLRQYFDITGLGNSLPMMKLLSRVGAAIGEDGFGKGDGASTAPKTLGQIFYPERSGAAG